MDWSGVAIGFRVPAGRSARPPALPPPARRSYVRARLALRGVEWPHAELRSAPLDCTHEFTPLHFSSDSLVLLEFCSGAGELVAVAAAASIGVLLCSLLFSAGNSRNAHGSLIGTGTGPSTE